MEPGKPHFPPNPLLSLSSFVHNQCLRLGAELSGRFDETRRFAGSLAGQIAQSPAANWRHRSAASPVKSSYPPFASVTQIKPGASNSSGGSDSNTLSPAQVAKSLVGTPVYTVSNTNNEFVLVSDPSGVKSIGLLCFRQEDAEAFLAQARLRRRELKSNAKVVPITLDQVYSLKVEGIAFRFLPDPVQIRNALELKSTDIKSGFDGVPVFQSDLLVVRKKNRRYCPIYFSKEDIEKELTKFTRASRGDSHIMVGSLEDVLKKMETSEKNSGWEDLIFIPPGKSHTQHIQDVFKV